MTLDLPSSAVGLPQWLDAVGHRFVTIEGHDSGCTSYGVRVGDERWFVKAAYGADVAQLDAAWAVHRRVRHRAIVPVIGRFDLDGEREPGQAIVTPWVDGAILNDPFAPGSLPYDDPGSSLNRFRALPVEEVLAAYDEILDAHLAVAAAGLVAVDFYDGCLIYDFADRRMWLVDLDLYAPPYTLGLDRQYGSSRFMAPEEWVRGSHIDERTTVFTLARAACQLLCLPGGDETTWRGGPAQLAVLRRATRPDPEARPAGVADFVTAWRGAD